MNLEKLKIGGSIVVKAYSYNPKGSDVKSLAEKKWGGKQQKAPSDSDFKLAKSPSPAEFESELKKLKFKRQEGLSWPDFGSYNMYRKTTAVVFEPKRKSIFIGYFEE